MAKAGKKKKHIKGDRLYRFKEKLKGLRGEEIMGVAVDVSKSFHKVILFDFDGNVLRGPFLIDILQEGYNTLKGEINRIREMIGARKVFIVLEPTSIYHENIARHLKIDFGEVYFVNPSQVSSNRAQDLLRGLKTDDIDLGAMAELLIAGKGYEYNLEGGIYLELKEEAFWRERKLKIQTQLKNQIRIRVDKLYPGLSCQEFGNDPLVKDLWDDRIALALLAVALTGQGILSSTSTSLMERFKEAGHPIGEKEVERIKEYFTRMLLPEEGVARIELKLLRRDLRLLKALEEEIKGVEEGMVEKVKETWGKRLIGKVKGLSGVLIASYVGCIGRIERFRLAPQIFKKSGLASKVAQSGPIERKGRIRRDGSKVLRTVLYKMAKAVSLHNPYFSLYHDHLKEKKGKPEKKALIALANKLNRVLFALQRDDVAFSPPPSKIDYLERLFRERKREKREKRLKRNLERMERQRKGLIHGPKLLALKATGLG